MEAGRDMYQRRWREGGEKDDGRRERWMIQKEEETKREAKWDVDDKKDGKLVNRRK